MEHGALLLLPSNRPAQRHAAAFCSRLRLRLNLAIAIATAPSGARVLRVPLPRQERVRQLGPHARHVRHRAPGPEPGLDQREPPQPRRPQRDQVLCPAQHPHHRLRRPEHDAPEPRCTPSARHFCPAFFLLTVQDDGAAHRARLGRRVDPALRPQVVLDLVRVSVSVSPPTGQCAACDWARPPPPPATRRRYACGGPARLHRSDHLARPRLGHTEAAVTAALQPNRRCRSRPADDRPAGGEDIARDGGECPETASRRERSRVLGGLGGDVSDSPARWSTRAPCTS